MQVKAEKIRWAEQRSDECSDSNHYQNMLKETYAKLKEKGCLWNTKTNLGEFLREEEL